MLVGRVMSKQHEMVGKIFPTNNGGDCIVVEYISAMKVRVRFLDYHEHEVQTSMKSVRLGTIRNPFAKSVHGVGYLGFGKYRTVENGVHTKAYILWSSIIERCYSERFLMKNPTYRGCTVCEDWYNFQNFAEWYYSQEFGGIGYEIDKDVLSGDEKMYSPNTCCFLPKEINTLFNESKATRTNMPQGVYLNKRTGSYVAQLSVGTGKREYFGSHKTPEDAFEAYKIAKELYVKEVVMKWKGKIDDKVFSVLMGWTLD